MRLLLHVPLKRKLIIITMVTTTLALALACAAFTLYDQVILRRGLVRDLSSTAKMVGFNSSSALSFNDPSSAEQTLKSLVAQPKIVAACIYGRNGVVFARYFRAGESERQFPATTTADREEFLGERLELLRRIELDGEVIGRVFLQSDLSELRERLLLSVLVFAVVMPGAGLIALAIVSRLQRVISDPVSQLAAVANRVTSESNYALRATRHGNDEVGALIDGFNGMLAQIQARDVALQEAHDDLEKRVEDRTGELRAEIIERRRSDEERNRVFTLSLDYICIARFDSSMRRVNPAMERALGYTTEELASTPYLDLVHPDDMRNTTLRLARVLKRRSVQEIENRCRCADGSYRSIMWTLVPFHAEDCLYAYGRDVTELKRSQEEVAREQARFKLIFDSVPVGISIVATDRRETLVANPAHERITGISAENLLQPGIFERATHPGDLDIQRNLVQKYKAGEIDQFSLEKRYLHPDGKIVWAALTRRMFADPDTGKTQSITTITDITALKGAQEEVARERARFKFIFDSVPVGISLILPGTDGLHVVNPAHERITGVSIEDSSTPGIFARISHPDDYRAQQAYMKKYSAGEIDRFSVEKRYLHPGGKVVWALLTSRLIPDPTTEQQQSLTTLVDITEHKSAEAKLAESHRELVDISRQAGMAEVATSVLHNVGNVLNSVNVSTTLLTDLVGKSKIKSVARLGELLAEHRADLAGFLTLDPRGQKVVEFVQALSGQLALEQRSLLIELASLRKNVEHIKEIVARQQHYAKVSGVSETMAVTDLIEDAVRMNSDILNGTNVTLVRDFRAQPKVTVDKHKLLQILVNLMRNAKFACDDWPRADKQVSVRVTTGAGRVQIAVIDNGVGIPPENLIRIFSHGFTTRKQGHGFGLHSGALAARELGGSLVAQSDGPGRGATFVLELAECSAAVAA